MGGTWKRVTPKRLPDIFKNILAMDDETKKVFCEEFNRFLDDLRDDDFFGTEGQTDPRGDPRD